MVSPPNTVPTLDRLKETLLIKKSKSKYAVEQICTSSFWRTLPQRQPHEKKEEGRHLEAEVVCCGRFHILKYILLNVLFLKQKDMALCSYICSQYFLNLFLVQLILGDYYSSSLIFVWGLFLLQSVQCCTRWSWAMDGHQHKSIFQSSLPQTKFQEVNVIFPFASIMKLAVYALQGNKTVLGYHQISFKN